jgi:hypothetical protein
MVRRRERAPTREIPMKAIARIEIVQRLRWIGGATEQFGDSDRRRFTRVGAA